VLCTRLATEGLPAADNCFEHNVRTTRPGEEVAGQVLGHVDRVASIVANERIVALDPR
jgi:cell filamentation protein